MDSLEVYRADIGYQVNLLLKFGADRRDEKRFRDLYKKNEFQFFVTLKDVDKLSAQNAFIQQKIQQKCWPVLRDALAAKFNDAFFSGIVGPLDGKRWDEIERQLKKHSDIEVRAVLNKHGDALGKTALAVVQQASKDVKEYDAEVKQAGLMIVVHAGALAASVGVLATAGWTGAGTVVGAIGALRSLGQLVEQIYGLVADLSTLVKAMTAKMDSLEKHLNSNAVAPLKKSAKIANTAKQAGAQVMSKALVIEIRGINDTIEGLEKDFQTARMRTKGARVKVAELSKKIKEILTIQDVLAKELQSLQKQLWGELQSRRSDAAVKTLDKKIKDAKDELARLPQILDKTLTSAGNLGAVVSEFEDFESTYSGKLDKLKKACNPKALAVLSVATEVVLAAGEFAAADFSKGHKAVEKLHEHAEKLQKGTEVAVDGFKALKDMITAVDDSVETLAEPA